MLRPRFFVPYRVAGMRARAGYVGLDALVFVFIWLAVTNINDVRLPISFMQRYSRANYEAYITVMTSMTVSLFVLSVIMHWLFGGYLGKLIAGYRTVRIDGRRMSILQTLARSFGLFLIGLMIMAPGPLIAYVFGEGSELPSSVALMLGVCLWICLAWLPLTGTTPGLSEDESLPALEKWLGVMTVAVDRNNVQSNQQG